MTNRRAPPDFVVVLDASLFPCADVSTVDALARAQCAIRRDGGEIRLREPPDRLRDLIGLLGLNQILPEQP